MYLPLPEFNFKPLYLRSEIHQYVLLVNAKCERRGEVIEQKLHSDIHEYKVRIYFNSTIEEVKALIIVQFERPKKIGNIHYSFKTLCI